jgi:hypothetical protein
MKLFKFLRNINPVNNILVQTTRGPKKKAEKKDIIKSEHILNFYKNADDVAILPDEYYPKWVLDLHKFRFNLDEMIDSQYFGHLVYIILTRLFHLNICIQLEEVLKEDLIK